MEETGRIDDGGDDVSGSHRHIVSQCRTTQTPLLREYYCTWPCIYIPLDTIAERFVAISTRRNRQWLGSSLNRTFKSLLNGLAVRLGSVRSRLDLS